MEKENVLFFYRNKFNHILINREKLFYLHEKHETHHRVAR